MSAPSGKQIRPECQFEMHDLCRQGPVVTQYGDVALTIRCDCPCHRRTPAKEAR